MSSEPRKAKGAKRNAVLERAAAALRLTLDALRFARAPAAVNAAEGAAGAAVNVPAATSLATLLSRHILRDGELVILLLKPSLWFILLASLRFSAVVLLVVIALRVFVDSLPGLPVWEGGLFLIAGRVMWAVLQWSSRLYVLTDLRIVSISGVFNPVIFDCALRRIARTRLIYSSRERICRLGTIEIIPLDQDQPDGLWQTIAKPKLVHEQVVAAINKAKQGGCVA
jgi:hypothetical protein